MAILEICAADIDSAHNAARGGANRIELCSALEIGGVTPSLGLIQQATAIPEIKVNVLIRPRGGDFVYTPAECDVMLRDIEAAGRWSANGVVIGALTPDGDIDMPMVEQLVKAARDNHLEITFHRAFDRAANMPQALEQLIKLGCDRVLTSGGRPTAMEGLETIARLQRQGAGRISIMPGSGVNALNVGQILAATGCHEVHASAKMPRPTQGTDPVLREQGEGSCFITSTPEVEALKLTVNQF